MDLNAQSYYDHAQDSSFYSKREKSTLADSSHFELIVLTGEGRFFSAGADVTSMQHS